MRRRATKTTKIKIDDMMASRPICRANFSSCFYKGVCYYSYYSSLENNNWKFLPALLYLPTTTAIIIP